MGIPSFYRWLVEKYPLSVIDVLEEVPVVVNGVSVPVDTSNPNPNGFEFDNLYLDMNGIIHPCFHPENQPAPKTYEEVFKAIFKYIDRLFTMIRPRKLLYMAVDGVAPRAKMNQQRGRRFRAAKDAAEVAAEAERLRHVFESEGKTLAQSEQSEVLDSNVITPGTEFMATLSTALRYYIHLRLNGDPGWRGIKVILSDANVPGEGEHKIMSYIRLQRNLPGFDPNTWHCLYGLDADLIMLALATHEIHFVILREDVRMFQKDRNSKVNKATHIAVQSEERNGRKQGELVGADCNDDISKQQFQFLNIWVLRDYLEHDLRIPDPTVKADLERLVDDFVFMCLFVGNDFLPHMPSLEISEGAIDLLMTVYKKEFVRMGGYLTNSFEVDLERVEHFIQVVGSNENAIFRRRSQLQKEREIRSQGNSNGKPSRSRSSSSLSRFGHKTASSLSYSTNRGENEFKRSMKGRCHMATDVATSGNAVADKVRLGEDGWKERYYAEKFGVNTKDDCEKSRKHAVLKYAEGICWVMHYYYQGVCSWQWFYPYHYAPFASDFHGLDKQEIVFTLGKPFKPFDQLMGVLPAARKLMTDPSSPIADFYPTDFEVDLNGKRYAWQGVSKLPFIKESRLLAEIVKVEDTLTDEEKQRNSLGSDVLFVHMSHPLEATIISFHRRKRKHPKFYKAKIKRRLDSEISGGMNGYIYISDNTGCLPEITSPFGDTEDITKNHVISVLYKYPPIHPHIPRPPKGVDIPRKFITKRDVHQKTILWHERTAVTGRILSERPVPKSFSGSCLKKMARQLVSKYYVGKQKQSNGLDPLGVAANGSCISTEIGGERSRVNGEMISRVNGKRKQRDRDRSSTEMGGGKNRANGKRRKNGKGRKRKQWEMDGSCISTEMGGEKSGVNWRKKHRKNGKRKQRRRCE